VQLLLPTDVVIADKFDPEANAKTVKADAIPDGWMVRKYCWLAEWGMVLLVTLVGYSDNQLWC
jgi:hypothetical protein